MYCASSAGKPGPKGARAGYMGDIETVSVEKIDKS